MKKLFICYLLHFIIIILSFAATSYAQIHQRYLHLTTNQGLAHNRVNATFQDSKGFIWFGTNAGLNRYDGHQFKTYSFIPFDSCSIRSNHITSIIEDNEGKLWIGTIEGLCSFDPITECFRYWEIKNLQYTKDGYPYKILRDKQGMLWIITQHAILKRFDPNTEETLSFGKKGAFGHTFEIQEDKTGRYLFLNVQQKDIRVFDKQQLKFISHQGATHFKRPAGYHTQFIIKDFRKKLWLYRGNAHTMQQVDLATGHTETFREPFQAEKKITDSTQLTPFPHLVFQDGEGIIWKSTPYGLSAFDPEQRKFIKNHPIQGRQKKTIQINHVLTAKSGLVWLATETGTYALNMRASQLQMFRFGGMVETIYEDSDGAVWVGGRNGLKVFEPYKSASPGFARYRSKCLPEMKSHHIKKICADPLGRQNILWLSVTGAGLFKFDKHTQLFTSCLPKDSGNHIVDIYDIVPDQGNMLWMVCDNGLQRFNVQDQTFKWYKYNSNDPQGLPEDLLPTLYKDRQGELWIGSDEHGMGQFDKLTGEFTWYAHHPQQKNSLSHNSIIAFYEDKQGNFWVATAYGLNLFDRKTHRFKHYTIKDGLPKSRVYTILEGPTGKLWLSTRHGISKFDPVNEIFINYDQRDGLLSNEFFIHAAFKNKQGKMFFGGVDGVTAFYPEQLGTNCYSPPVVITKFKKFNKEIHLPHALSPEGKLALSHKDNVVSFEIAALSFYNAYKNQYAYKLEGLHNNWIQLGTRREITFTSLNPGNYTLRIKAANNDGVWNEKGFMLKISVKPPFWATWWFRLGTGVLLIGLILIIYTVRIQRIQQQKLRLELEVDKRTLELKKANQTKDRFFAIIAHDLRGPLTSFREIGKLIRYFIKKEQPEKIEKLGDKIDQSAKRLNNLLNNLLNWALVQQKAIAYHPESISLTTLVNDCVNTYQGSIHTHQIRVHTNIPENLLLWADAPSVTSLIQNLISNAIKFTPERGFIEIQAYRQANQTIVSVKDSGIGMSKKTLEQVFDISHKKSQDGLRGETGSGLGLTLCQAFAQLNKAELTAESTLGESTTFFLTFRNQPDKLTDPSSKLSDKILSKKNYTTKL